MGVLESVLAYKERQRQQEEENSLGVANAINMFNQSVQVARENRLKELMFKGDLAQKGIKLNSDGSFGRDESLESPTDKLLKQGQVADAQMKIYQAGGPAPSMFGQGKSAQSNGQQGELVATEYDEFGRPKGYTDMSAEAKKTTLKNEQELNRKQGVLLRVGKRIVDEYKKTVPSENRLAQLASIPGSYLQMNEDQKNDSVYRDFVNSLKAQMARGQGEVGNLSAPEQAAVLNAVASLGDVKSVGNDKLINYFKNIAEVSTDKKTQKEALSVVEKLTGEKEDKKEIFSGLPKEFGPNKVDLNKLLENSISPGANFLNSALGIPFTDISPKGLTESLGYKYPEGNDATSRIGDLIGSVAGTFANVPLRAAGSLLGMLKSGQIAKSAETVAQATAPIAQEGTIAMQKNLAQSRPYLKTRDFINTAREAVYGKGGYLKQEGEIYANNLKSLKGSNSVIKEQKEIANTIRQNFSSNTGNMLTPQLKEQINILESLAKKGKLTEGKLVEVMKNIANKGSAEQAAINKQAVTTMGKYLKGDTAKKWSLMQQRYSSVMENIDRVSKHIGTQYMVGGGKGKGLETLISRMINSAYDEEALKDLQLIGNLSNQPNMAKAINNIQSVNFILNKGSINPSLIPKNFGGGIMKLLRGVPPVGKDVARDTEETLLKQITKFPKKK